MDVQTALRRRMRGSRRKSSALRDCHIIPTYNSPSMIWGSTLLMRGEPSARMVPTTATRPGANCSWANAAKSGAAVTKVCHDMDMPHPPVPRLRYWAHRSIDRFVLGALGGHQLEHGHQFD